MCKLLLLLFLLRERERDNFLGGKFNNEYYHHRTTRKRTRRRRRIRRRNKNDGDVLPLLLPLISPRPPLLFICLPFLTTFNNFLVNFPSANGETNRAHRILFFIIVPFSSFGRGRRHRQPIPIAFLRRLWGVFLLFLGFLRALFAA